MTTPNLQLAEPADAAFEGADEVRETFRVLDATGPGVIAVLSRATLFPPAGTSQGDRYIVPAGASGAFTGHARHLAFYTADGWSFRVPRQGWFALVLDEAALGLQYTYDGTEWVPFAAVLAAVDAADVIFDGYGVGMAASNVEQGLDELYLAQVADEAVIADHETRIQDLEDAGGGGGSGAGGAIFINVTQPAGNTVASSSGEVTFSSGKEIDTAMFTVGTILRLSMAGTYGTDAVPPTLRLRVKLGTVNVLDSGAVTLIGGVVARGWSASALLAVHTIGASGDIEAQGAASFSSASGVAIPIDLSNTATINVDTTAGPRLQASIQWGASDADNTITLRQFLVERLEAAPTPDLIVLRGSPSRQALTSGATSFTINTPAGVIADDFLLVYLSRENSATTGSWATVTAPSGWAQVEDADLGAYNQLLIFAKRAGGSEPSDYTFTWPGSPALYTDAGDAGIVAYSGVNTSTGIADSQVQTNAGSSNSLTAPSATSDADGSKLVCFFMGGDGNAPSNAISAPPSMTELTKRPGSNYANVTMAEEPVGSGATGPRVATFDSSAFPSQCVSVVLKPV